MYVMNDVDVPATAIPDIQHRTLAGAERGLAHLSVWRQAVIGGGATPPHRHDCEEVVIVEAGHGDLVIDGVAHPFGPGTTLVIPPNVDHQIINTGYEAMRIIAVFSATPVEVFTTDGQPLPLPWAS